LALREVLGDNVVQLHMPLRLLITAGSSLMLILGVAIEQSD